ncbi:UvrD-helicase domain-containing protein [Azospirillum argentinense]
MPRIPIDAWRPKGIEDLEENAWRALRAQENIAVVAGPGAGKTEFLAQRAAFLLETGLCPDPRLILAISFKRDAATNLADRVERRCRPDLARRFVSMTFDAFAKSLLDRFVAALPVPWRPILPYKVVFASARDISGFIQQATQAAPRGEWQGEIAAIPTGQFESHGLGSLPLHDGLLEPTNGRQWAILRWWRESLEVPGGSRLTFVMINRLAELLLRTNPQILRALRATYSHVFLDEFQDTTHAQYALLRTAFGGDTVLTAVGDDKQRIMTWAGARPDAFARFQGDFGAERIALLCNYRSSPDLVRIQHVVARAIEPEAAAAVSMAPRSVDGDVAQIWHFNREATEAERISAWIAQDRALTRLGARDYCILVRQRADKVEALLERAFAAQGLALRNESAVIGRTTLQDLLAEDLTEMALAILRLATAERAPAAWTTVAEAITLLRAVDRQNEAACRRVECERDAFLTTLRARLAAEVPNGETAGQVMQEVIAFLDPAALARSVPRYTTGETLEIAGEALSLHFAASAEGAADWSAALDRCEGIEQIPLLTIHKSKGLEYHTVFFLGLDDSQWWSHTAANPEGLATFFVALSRAKQRVFFTYCAARGTRRKVDDLYTLLRQAGVQETAP